jgi:hypothetical protein
VQTAPGLPGVMQGEKSPPSELGRKDNKMLVKELVSVAQDDELFCLQTINYESLEITGKRQMSPKYTGCEVICFYSERYPAYSNIGTTITIRV